MTTGPVSMHRQREHLHRDRTLFRHVNQQITNNGPRHGENGLADGVDKERFSANSMPLGKQDMQWFAPCATTSAARAAATIRLRTGRKSRA